MASVVAVQPAVRSDTYTFTSDLAVAWGGAMTFDLVVVVMTLVKTIKINRRTGGGYALTRVLMRDGKSASRHASESC